MKRLFRFDVLIAIGSIAGCTWYDAMFSVFGGAYTDGGTTFSERGDHYDRKVESYSASGGDYSDF